MLVGIVVGGRGVVVVVVLRNPGEGNSLKTDFFISLFLAVLEEIVDMDCQ